MDKSKAWFALGLLAATLMMVVLGQELVAAGSYLAHAVPLNPTAMLNPLYSPLLALVAGLVFTLWTLVKARRMR